MIEELLDRHFPAELVMYEDEPISDRMAAMKRALMVILPVDCGVSIMVMMNVIMLEVFDPKSMRMHNRSCTVSVVKGKP